MRIFLASLGTETNTFSPFVTSRRDFEETYLARAGNYGDQPFIFAVPMIVWRREAQERGWDVVESLCTFAQPGGITRRDVYESFRDEILHDLRQAMPVDAVFLSLHGAMVAAGYDDCEGDLIARVRQIVGPDAPIGVELDLHCHLTQQMVDNATAIVTFKEYPHVDFAERATELFDIIAGTLAGTLQPRMALYDCGMIGVYHTTQQPMQDYVEKLKTLEGQNGVLSISVGHGFPWGDVPDMGTRILVVTDGRPERGAALAEELGQQLFALREQLQPDYTSIDEALDVALASDATPVVLADVADNAGGGAPSDSTFLLRALLDRGVENAAVGLIWDPVAVKLATDAGAGTTFDLRLGGKMGPTSGDPVDLRVTVTKVVSDATQTFGQGPDKAQNRMGDAVALHARGIDLVVNSIRTQTFHPDAFTNLGIDPSRKRIVVVKSMQHFHAGFAPIAGKILYVATPGALMPDFQALPYRRVNHDLWPLSSSEQ